MRTNSETVKKVKEVHTADRFVGVYNLLEAFGYDVSELTTMQLATINHKVKNAIQEFLNEENSDDEYEKTMKEISSRKAS